MTILRGARASSLIHTPPTNVNRRAASVDFSRQPGLHGFMRAWICGLGLLASGGGAAAWVTGIHATDYRHAATLGVRALRLWDFNALLSDAHVEPTTNRWVDHTATLQKMRAAGLTPVAVLYTRQPWRCSADGLPDLGLRNGVSPWMQYVEEVVRRHRSAVRYWEIWNEPDVPAFGGERSPAQYVELARQAALVIRRHHAGRIIAGGTPWPGGAWIGDCLDAGLARHCDILSIHYGYTGERDRARQLRYIEQVRQLRARSGLPVWNTETSILKYTVDGGEPNLPEADALDRILRVNREAGVEAVFYYYFAPGNFEHPESLLDWRGYLRPWAHVLRKYGGGALSDSLPPDSKR
jgi:hypothetical protein